MADTYIPARNLKDINLKSTLPPMTTSQSEFKKQDYKMTVDLKQESIVYQSSLKVVAELVAAGKEDQLDKVLLLARKVARLALNPNLQEILDNEPAS